MVIQKLHDARRPDSRKDEPGYNNNNWLLQYSNTSQKADEIQPTPTDVLQRFLKATDVPRLVDQLLDQVDWQEYDPPLYRDEFGRVLRSPIKRKGHLSMDLCTPYGLVERAVIAKSDVKHVPSLYTALRKTTFGGLFPYIMNEGYSTHRRLSPFAGGHEEQLLLQQRAHALAGARPIEEQSVFARPTKVPDILATLQRGSKIAQSGGGTTKSAGRKRGLSATALIGSKVNDGAAPASRGRTGDGRRVLMDHHQRRRAARKSEGGEGPSGA